MSEKTHGLTIDQLAARVGMTVRNVRAYAGRGLLAAPRLVGRKGFYDEAHVARLGLIQDLQDRGYTLAAIERMLGETPTVVDVHAHDLIQLLANPLGDAQEPEIVTIDSLLRLANLDRSEDFFDRLEELGFLEQLDDDRVRLLQPAVVRVGAQALALGLSRETVLGLYGAVTTATDEIAEAFVQAFVAEVWRPFQQAGMPADQWPDVSRRIEGILPVASQAVIAAFRISLSASIQDVLGEEIAALTATDPAAPNA